MDKTNRQKLTLAKHFCDVSFRELLANRQILARILKGCIAEFSDCSYDDIAEKYIEPDVSVGTEPLLDTPTLLRGDDSADKSFAEGSIFYDVIFRASAPLSNETIGLIINIEEQGDYRPGSSESSYDLVTRGIYYCARMISAQRGRVFSGDDYGKLQKVYSIWICPKPYAAHRGSMTAYSLTEIPIHGQAFRNQMDYDKICIIIIGLDEPNGNADPSVEDFLSTLFARIPDSEKFTLLEEKYGMPRTNMEEYTKDMVGYGDLIEADALERGLEEGRLVGKLEGSLQAAGTLYNQKKISLEDAASVLGLSQDEFLEKLKALNM